jgi:5-methylcytosine-specific restriction endonuclease McrA
MKNLRATNPIYAVTAHDYYQRNKPTIQQKTARYYAKYPHKRQAQRKQYLQTHREQIRAHTQRRRARLKQNGFVESINLEILAIRDHWRCHICRKKVTRKNWSHDHLIPVADGGETSYRNVALAHRICNNRRHRGKTISAQLRLLP